MSKTPSRKLFDLVKSLSGSEKRYFKLFVNKNGTDKHKKYFLLFDAIDAQEVFDDDFLQQVVYQGETIQSRKYSELKAYLYDLILKSLQGYDENSSIDYKFKGMLQSVRVLYKRGHYSDCKDLLQKTKKLALKYENFTTILEILHWEKHIAYTLIDIAFWDKELDRIDEEEKACLQQLQNFSEYRNIFFRIFTIIKKSALASRKETEITLQKLIDHPLLKNENAPQSHLAKVIYYRIYAIYNYASADFDSFYKNSQYLLELMESKPFLLKEDISEYISVLSNYILSCTRSKKYKEWEQSLDKFLKIKPNTYDDKLKIHRQYYQGKLTLCFTTGDFEGGLEALELHLEEVKKFDAALFERSVFYFSYFYVYFGVGDYDRALEYLNKWLNLPRTVERQTYQVYARILNLIIHYEMDNTILLESLMRSTYRFLRKVDQLRPTEKKILAFIKASTKVYSAKEKEQAFLDLKKEMGDLSESCKIGPFDLSVWLESKINKEPFATIVKRRFEASLKTTEK